MDKLKENVYMEKIGQFQQKAKLPDRLQLLVDQEEVECDIWELQSQEPDDKPAREGININGTFV
jgi:hypothetical protein